MGIRYHEKVKEIKLHLTSILSKEERESPESFRLEYIKQAFGKYFPNEIEGYLKDFDEYMRQMDEIYDDEKLPHEKRQLDVIGINRSVQNFLISPEWVREEFVLQMGKMEEIGIVEKLTIADLLKTSNQNEALEISKVNYNTRAMSADFAARIPAKALNLDTKSVEDLQTSARAHRSFFILTKDVKDLKHDEINKSYTPFLIFVKKGYNPEKLVEFIYYDSLENIDNIISNTTDKVVEYVSSNFKRMIEKRRKETEMFYNKVFE